MTTREWLEDFDDRAGTDDSKIKWLSTVTMTQLTEDLGNSDTSDRAKGRHLTNPIYKELPNGRAKTESSKTKLYPAARLALGRGCGRPGGGSLRSARTTARAASSEAGREQQQAQANNQLLASRDTPTQSRWTL